MPGTSELSDHDATTHGEDSMIAPPRAGTKVSSLAESWVFGVLSERSRDALMARGATRSYSADEVLYLAGTPAQTLYIVLEGRVRVMRGEGGRAYVLHVETAGGSLGEVPLFEGTTYPATAIAAESTRCLALGRDAVLAAVRTDPDLALAFLSRLAGRVRLLVERMDQQTGHSTLSRLAALLIERAAAAEGRTFTLGATQQQTAEEIGTVRELVVRGLRTLRDRGAIESRGGGRYIVTNAAVLNEIAASGQ
jgi:CRP/FNR family transcriptional regulator